MDSLLGETFVGCYDDDDDDAGWETLWSIRDPSMVVRDDSDPAVISWRTKLSPISIWGRLGGLSPPHVTATTTH